MSKLTVSDLKDKIADFIESQDLNNDDEVSDELIVDLQAFLEEIELE